MPLAVCVMVGRSGGVGCAAYRAMENDGAFPLHDGYFALNLNGNGAFAFHVGPFGICSLKGVVLRYNP